VFNINFRHPDPQVAISILVIYQFYAPNDRFVEVRVGEAETEPIAEVCQGAPALVSPGTTNLGANRLSSNRANIGTEASDCLWWVKGHSSGWTCPHDLIAYPVDGTMSSCPGDIIKIVAADYDHTDSMSDIHHETGHFIQYNVYGDAYPTHEYDGSHDFDDETDEGFAIMEGWAEYVASSSYTIPPDLPPNKYTPFEPGADVWWRGTDGTGTDNAGNIVEGAIFRTWATIDDFQGV
jgi:hypothetical protein